MTPRVSILLPMWNAARTIDSCLRSISRQTWTEWECVVVDDGSNDGAPDIVRRVAARDARFRLITAEHRGLVETLNRGIDACRAPLVARMDADDCMHRARLESQIRLLDAEPRLCAVGTHVRMFPREPSARRTERALPGEAEQTRKGRGAYESWINSIVDAEDVAREAYVECPIAHPTLMLRADVLERYRYRDMGWPEDYDLMLRLLATGQAVSVVPRRLHAWRDHDARLSRTSPSYSLARFVACKAHHLCSTLLRGREDYVLWGYGDTGRMLMHALSKLDRNPTHIVELHPRRIGNTIHGATVVPPEALATLERKPLVASVAGSRPRAEIRNALTRLDYVEGTDFVCAA